MTARPPRVAIRALKPCVRFRFKLLGWNVLFIGESLSYQSKLSRNHKSGHKLCQSLGWLLFNQTMLNSRVMACSYYHNALHTTHYGTTGYMIDSWASLTSTGLLNYLYSLETRNLMALAFQLHSALFDKQLKKERLKLGSLKKWMARFFSLISLKYLLHEDVIKSIFSFSSKVYIFQH